MKKSNFVAMLLGTIGGVLFALGMCMALVPEWGTTKEGTIVGCIGLVVLLITWLVWRKMENKASIHLSFKVIGLILLGTVGVLALGAGLSLVTVWSNIVLGIIVGLVGIVLLICLIPATVGIKG